MDRRRILLAIAAVVATLGGILLPLGMPAPPGSVGALADPPPNPATLASDPVVAAAGDIACDPTSTSYKGGAGTSSACRQRYVSDLLLAMNPAAVLTLGDNQYYCGGLSAFHQVYDPTWGRLKAITHPVVGNHEYLTSRGTGCTSANARAAGHFDYFGAAAGQRGQGYYSFDVGAWHLIAINSNCGDAGGCGPTSPQGRWLAADLAAHQNLCTLAFWHIPLFSSGGRASANTRSIWGQLWDAGADVVLAGHDHTYERFSRQTNSAVRDDRSGIREFIVGTGGANHTPFVTTAANSEVRNHSTFGVIKLTLHADSYDWLFVPEVGASFTDMGSENCHGKPSDTTPPSQPTDLTGAVVSPGQVNLWWTASTDATGVSNYLIRRDRVQVATSKTASYSDVTALPGATHTYVVSAVDYNGWSSAPSAPVNVTVPPDVTPPSVPTNLHAAAIRPDSVDLAWTASADDTDVASYRVFRDGQLVGSSTTTTFTDPVFQSTTTYSYAVSAMDRSNNESAESTPVLVATPARPTTITLTPIADAYVRADTPSSSSGTSTTVIADGSPVKRTLLKFNVSGVAGRPVLRAALRMWCVDPSSVGGTVHRVLDTTWTEAVTWNSAPAASASDVASQGAVTPGRWYEWDVTAIVSGDGLLALDLTSTNSNGAYYSGREATEAQRPQLVVTTAP